MSFRVGQRVRITVSTNLPIGSTATIVAEAPYWNGWWIDSDERKCPHPDSINGGWVSRADEMVPIDDTYDGNTVTTWDQCVYRPRVNA